MNPRPQVAILTSEMFEDDQVFYPMFRLNQAGIKPVVITMIESPLFVLSRRGRPLKTDDSARETNASEFDALIIPGGGAPYMIRKNEAVLEFVRQFVDSNMPVLAIREGMLVLLSADVLEDRAASADWDLEKDVIKSARVLSAINWIDRDVVADGNIITTRADWEMPGLMSQIIGAVGPSGGEGFRPRAAPPQRAGMRAGTRAGPGWSEGYRAGAHY